MLGYCYHLLRLIRFTELISSDLATAPLTLNEGSEGLRLSQSLLETPGLKRGALLNSVSPPSQGRETPIYKAGAESAFSCLGTLSPVKIACIQNASHVSGNRY